MSFHFPIHPDRGYTFAPLGVYIVSCVMFVRNNFLFLVSRAPCTAVPMYYFALDKLVL